jgi:hypothetical protein
MIEVTLLNYLNNVLSVPAYMERPENPPARFVLIEKTGSNRQNLVRQSTFAVQSIAESLAEAAILNDGVLTAMDGILELDEISKVEQMGDYYFPNTQRKEYRYQAVFRLTHF